MKDYVTSVNRMARQNCLKETYVNYSDKVDKPLDKNTSPGNMDAWFYSNVPNRIGSVNDDLKKYRKRENQKISEGYMYMWYSPMSQLSGSDMNLFDSKELNTLPQQLCAQRCSHIDCSGFVYDKNYGDRGACMMYMGNIKVEDKCNSCTTYIRRGKDKIPNRHPKPEPEPAPKKEPSPSGTVFKNKKLYITIANNKWYLRIMPPDLTRNPPGDGSYEVDVAIINKNMLEEYEDQCKFTLTEDGTLTNPSLEKVNAYLIYNNYSRIASFVFDQTKKKKDGDYYIKTHWVYKNSRLVFLDKEEFSKEINLKEADKNYRCISAKSAAKDMEKAFYDNYNSVLSTPVEFKIMNGSGSAIDSVNLICDDTPTQCGRSDETRGSKYIANISSKDNRKVDYYVYDADFQKFKTE